MRHWWRVAIAAAGLLCASPALASDFSGIGRVFWWGVAAIILLIAIPVAITRRKGQRGSAEGNATIAIAGAVMFAPAIVYRNLDEWLLMPLPGSAIAMLDGRWDVLWPVPLLSIIFCAAAFYWMLQHSGTPPAVDGGDTA